MLIASRALFALAGEDCHVDRADLGPVLKISAGQR